MALGRIMPFTSLGDSWELALLTIYYNYSKSQLFTNSHKPQGGP